MRAAEAGDPGPVWPDGVVQIRAKSSAADVQCGHFLGRDFDAFFVVCRIEHSLHGQSGGGGGPANESESLFKNFFE